MKRIHLYYDGVRYTVADREVAELKAEIAGALGGSAPHWLKVNHGEGALREIDLLIAPGIGIGVMPIEAEAEDRLPAGRVALPGDIT